MNLNICDFPKIHTKTPDLGSGQVEDLLLGITALHFPGLQVGPQMDCSNSN